MKVDAYSSYPHYWAHLEPIWEALPEAIRGTAYSPGRKTDWWGPRWPGRSAETNPVLVAAYSDYVKAARRPVFYVEHGAGQSYSQDARSVGNPSYSGGRGLDRVALFVCPNAAVAGRWSEAYPETPAVVVGCPKLDRWHGDGRAAACRTRRTAAPDQGSGALTVAITFHWHLSLNEETRSAWPYYDAALPGLVAAAAERGWRILGHGHPRLYGSIVRRWRALAVDHTPNLADVFDQADVLVGDNTSSLPEFASLGRPVVWLSAPWYRRDVEHGGRFWRWPQGQVHVEHPADLVAGIEEALVDREEVAAARRAMVQTVYAQTDGHAAERAAAAIVERLEAM